MPKFKVVYDAPFSNPEYIIEADSLEEAEKIANIKLVYKCLSVEEVDDY